MIKFPKFISSNKKESEHLKEDIVEENPLEESSEEEFDELTAVNEGQVTIHFNSVSPVNGALLVGFFVSNGLSRKVKFKKWPLLLILAALM